MRKVIRQGTRGHAGGQRKPTSKKPAAESKLEHMVIVQQGSQVWAKCGRGFSQQSKTEHGTIWWTRVTCDDCIDRMCEGNQEVKDYFNNKEPIW